MDWFVTGCLWVACVMCIVVSAHLARVGTPASQRGRWAMGVGFLLLATMLTLRLIEWGDLPMSPPYAMGLALVSLGYCSVALDRLRRPSVPKPGDTKFEESELP